MGNWVTINRVHVYIKDGQDPMDAYIRKAAQKNKGYKSVKNEHQKAIEELNQDKYEDGTYDLNTLTQVEYNDGYQVTFCQIGDNYTDEEYEEKVNEFIESSDDKRTSAGKFGGTPEVSFHVKDKEKAIKLAKKYNQISVWDWETADEIKTGGTGRR